MLATRASARSTVKNVRVQHRCFSLSTCRLAAPRLIAKCPESTCACEPMPKFPAGTDPVDKDSQLLGTVALHNRLVVVDTGAGYSGEAWPSKIENDGQGVGADVIRTTKAELGIKGSYFNSYWNAMVVASSFGNNSASPVTGSTRTSEARAGEDLVTTSALIFPQGIRIGGLKKSDVSGFIEQHILPSEAELATSLGRRRLQEEELKKLPLRKPAPKEPRHETSSVGSIVIFICGHAQRDARCGVLGPVLQGEFCRQLTAAGVDVSSEPTADSNTRDVGTSLRARVGLISHIGGHKFAGNVIIHLPQALHGNHPLAGRTVWYGRVEPKHVEGIVQATVLKGQVIRELLRGGMDAAGGMLSMGDFDVADD